MDYAAKREELREQFDRLQANEQIGENFDLNGCQCAYYEQHDGKCLGEHCYCH